MNYFIFLSLLLLGFILQAQDNFTVNVHESSDPDGMNPVTSYSASAFYMQENVFQKLLEYDPKTLTLRPVLAKEMPTVKTLTKGKYKGGMSITYEIHPDAVWDNGQPVTAEDYIFTVKAMLNPKVNNYYPKDFLNSITEIVVDKKNPQRFTIYSSTVYFRALEESGQAFFVLPEYHYDFELSMQNFSFKELNDPEKKETLRKHPTIIEFANKFYNASFAYDADKIVGSGAYKMIEWQTGQFIRFKKKENWWGDKVKTNDLLAAYPPYIVYKTITDYSSALKHAESGSLDVVRYIPPSKLSEIKNKASFQEKFDFPDVEELAYHYLGLNTQLPKLQEVNVRKAIAHAVNKTQIIQECFDGDAVTLDGPVFSFKDYYNSNIQAIDFNLEKAKSYLKEAGWSDSDGDGVLDKMIDGKLEKLSLTIHYNQGNSIRKKISEALQANLKKLQIELIIKSIDFPTLLDKVNQRDFDMIALAWVKDAGLDNMKQLWHRSSTSNRVGFGDANSDALIDKIQVTIDPKKRKKLYWEIQQKIVDSYAYIFLVKPKASLIISNRFDYPKPNLLRPFFTPRFLKLKE